MKRAIALRRLTKSEAARLGGLSPAVIGRFVDGERGLSGESIDALAAGLGLELVEGDLLEKAIAFTLETIPPEKREPAEEAFRMLRLCLKATSSMMVRQGVTGPGQAAKARAVAEPKATGPKQPRKSRTKHAD